MKNSAKTNPSQADALLQGVERAYTEKLRQSEKTSCCASSGPTVRGDYSSQEVESLPPEAVQSSFGCGNPLQFAGVQQGQTVLDIGSGAGIDCFLAAEKVGPQGKVIGLDMTPAMIEKASRIAQQRGYKNVEFRLGRADRMPVEDASVDWIVSNCVINLAPDKAAVFREAFRVLKPGGQLSISDIVLGGDLPQEVLDNFEAYVGCVAGAIREEEYLAAMLAAGLADVEVTSRFVYGREHMQGWLNSVEPGGSCCGCSVSLNPNLASRIEGKIWSAQISARKPA
jgi:SAM-dependent methyltransferase